MVTVFNSLITPEEETLELLKSIFNSENPQSVSENHRTLLTISPLYKDIISAVLKLVNILPASGGMAGIITMVDNKRVFGKLPQMFRWLV